MANAVGDNIVNPPAGNYYAIKTALTRFYQPSPGKRVLSFIQSSADRREVHYQVCRTLGHYQSGRFPGTAPYGILRLINRVDLQPTQQHLPICATFKESMARKPGDVDPVPTFSHSKHFSNVGKCNRIPITVYCVCRDASRVSRLLYIDDTSSDRGFPIDTGAPITIHPATTHHKQAAQPPANPEQLRFVDANGTEIRTYDILRLLVHLSDIKTSWSFILAEVKQLILSADHLRPNNLFVDSRGRIHLNANTCTTARLKVTAVSQHVFAVLTVRTKNGEIIVRLY